MIADRFATTFRPAFGLIALVLVHIFPIAVPAEEPGASPSFRVTPKPTAPIGIDYRFGGEPIIGQTLAITLTITPEITMTDAVLTLGADDPLALIEPTMPLSLGLIEARSAVEVEVIVLPLIVQTHYLNVGVSGAMGGRTQARNLVIPIRLPNEELRISADDEAGKTDARVRSFEAIETIR